MTALSDQLTIVAVVGGDLRAFATLLEKPPARIDAQSDSLPELRVTREGVLRVLVALQHKDVSPGLVQQWASFIGDGYFGSVEGPRSPIDIQYEPSAEDRIAEIIARLDELGDLIDGEISDEELSRMIKSMGHAS